MFSSSIIFTITSFAGDIAFLINSSKSEQKGDYAKVQTELGDIKLTEDKVLYSDVNKMVNSSGVIQIDTPKKNYKVRLNEYTDYFKNEMKSKGIKFL